MNKQFTAEEVHRLSNRIARNNDEIADAQEALRAFANMLEAQEKAVPVAWVRQDTIDDENGCPIGMDEPYVCWNAVCPDDRSGWSPLYSHPGPADAERLAEALGEILDYHGGAASALKDEYVVDRARQAIASHSAQAQLSPTKIADHIVDAIVDGLEVAQPPATSGNDDRGLLTGTTPSGIPYALRGTPESVGAVSGMLMIAGMSKEIDNG